MTHPSIVVAAARDKANRYRFIAPKCKGRDHCHYGTPGAGDCSAITQNIDIARNDRRLSLVTRSRADNNRTTDHSTL